jgi:hypothetical protein
VVPISKGDFGGAVETSLAANIATKRTVAAENGIHGYDVNVGDWVILDLSSNVTSVPRRPCTQ